MIVYFIKENVILNLDLRRHIHARGGGISGFPSFSQAIFLTFEMLNPDFIQLILFHILLFHYIFLTAAALFIL